MASTERLRGYNAALAAAGITPAAELVIESNFGVDGGWVATSSLLERAEPPTAIFAFNDQLAIGAMQTAFARNMRVPRTSQSSASTTPPRPSCSGPRSPRCANPSPRWAAWESVC